MADTADTADTADAGDMADTDDTGDMDDTPAWRGQEGNETQGAGSGAPVANAALVLWRAELWSQSPTPTTSSKAHSRQDR